MHETMSSTSMDSTENGRGLKIVDKQYYKLYVVREECTLINFVVQEKITSRGNLDLGYCFYEFSTEQQIIPYNQEVILMDQVNSID